MEPSHCLVTSLVHLWHWLDHGLYSLSEWTSNPEISPTLGATRLVVKIIISPKFFASSSAVLLPKCPWSIRVTGQFSKHILRLLDFARFGDEASYHLVNRGPVEFGTSRLLTLLLVENIEGCFVNAAIVMIPFNTEKSSDLLFSVEIHALIQLHEILYWNTDTIIIIVVVIIIISSSSFPSSSSLSSSSHDHAYIFLGMHCENKH